MIELKVTPRLREILKERNMTQMQLSELSGVKQATISRFDRNSGCDYITLFQLSKALEISIEELFTVEEE